MGQPPVFQMPALGGFAPSQWRCCVCVTDKTGTSYRADQSVKGGYAAALDHRVRRTANLSPPHPSGDLQRLTPRAVRREEQRTADEQAADVLVPLAEPCPPFFAGRGG